MSYHKSIVTSAVSTGRTWSNDHGLFHFHEIAFSDGNKGEYMSKDINQSFFAPGTPEVDYEMIVSNQGHAAKIKPYNPQFLQSGGPSTVGSPEHNKALMGTTPPQNTANTGPKFTQQQAINRTVALKVAVDSTDLHSEGVNKALERADAFSDWLEGYAKSFTEPNAEPGTDNDLPF